MLPTLAHEASAVASGDFSEARRLAGSPPSFYVNNNVD